MKKVSNLIYKLFELYFIMVEVGNLDMNLGGNFKLYFITVEVLFIYKFMGYFEMSFHSADVGNLDEKLGGYFIYFS